MMNKLKLMIDVLRTMKEKESIQGTFKATGRRDQVQIFRCENEFSRNTASGAGRVKLNSEFDWDGQKMKHESCTEFNLKDFQGQIHPGLMMRHMHGDPRCAAPGYGAVGPHLHHGMHCGGVKGGLSRIAFLLQVLNDIKLDEKEDGSVVLSLNLNDFPEEFKKAIQEKAAFARNHGGLRQPGVREPGEAGEFNGGPEGMRGGAHCGFMKELHTVTNPALTLNVLVNKNNEVERINLEFGGTGKNEANEEHEFNVKAELSFTW